MLPWVSVSIDVNPELVILQVPTCMEDASIMLFTHAAQN